MRSAREEEVVTERVVCPGCARLIEAFRAALIGGWVPGLSDHGGVRVFGLRPELQTAIGLALQRHPGLSPARLAMLLMAAEEAEANG